MYYLIFLFFGLWSIPTDTLEITVDNIKEIKGTMYVAIFDNASDFPQDNEWIDRHYEKVNASSMSIAIPNLKWDKEYALAIYQDVNDNGQMDKTGWVYPKNPLDFPTISNQSFLRPILNLVK